MSNLSKSVKIISNIFTLHNVVHTIIDLCNVDIMLTETNIKKVYAVFNKLGYSIAVGHIVASINKGKEHILLTFGTEKCTLIDKSEFVADVEKVFTDLGEQFVTGLTRAPIRFTILLDSNNDLTIDTLTNILEPMGIECLHRRGSVSIRKFIPGSIRSLNATIDVKQDNVLQVIF